MLSSLGEITSPSEWPESLPEMRNIDNLLRCSICKEFFDVAMMIQECSHNYCSLCIRQSINHKTQCPTCSVKVSGNDLKSNRVLDELVSNFVKVRSKLIALLTNKTTCIIQEDTIKNEMSDDSDGIFMKTPRGKNLLNRKKQSKGKSPRVNATPRNKRKRQKIIESDSDDPESYPAINASIKQESNPAVGSESPKVSTDNPSVGSPSSSQAGSISSFVECPVCGDMISGGSINNHLDACLTREEKKSSLRNKTTCTPETKSEQQPQPVAASTALVSHSTLSSQSSSHQKPSVSGSNAFISNKPKRKTLPQLVYTLLSDKKLKQKLKQWNLSTQGTRQAMIKRHQEFVTIYNAQCDSNNPKSASLIVKEIEIRERSKSKKFASGSTTDSVLHSLNKDSSSEEVEKAHQMYSQQYDDQFHQLINNVRMRNQKKAQSPTKDKKISTMYVKDSTEDIQETSHDNTIKKENNVLTSEENKTKPSVEDAELMDTSASGTKTEIDQRGSSPSKSQDIHTCNENARSKGDVLMDNEEQAQIMTSKEDKSVPEPPSPSSLVLLNDSDNDSGGEMVGCFDSSPSLGLASDDEEKELKNGSESDSEIFKTEAERTPIRAKSLRTRKR